MKPQRRTLSSVLFFAVAFVAVMGVAGLLRGQEKPEQQKSEQQKSQQRVPGIEDWSCRHVVFSNPGNFEQGTQNRSFTDWYKLRNDPRYQMALAKRRAALARGKAPASAETTTDSVESSVESLVSSATSEAAAKPAPKKTKPQGDWNNYLGGSASAGIVPATYPAKYTFDLNAPPSCSSDFLVVPVNKAASSGATASGTGTVSGNSLSATGSYTVTVNGVILHGSTPTAATASGSFSGNPTAGQTVTVGGANLTASAATDATATITVGTSFCFAAGQGVNVNGTSLTTSATAGSATFTVNHTPSPGEQVKIGGVTYTFESSLSGSTANQVLIESGNHGPTAENLAVAINNGGTCGYTSGGVCTRNVTAANPQVSSANSNNATLTMTALCTDNAAITNTGSSNVTVNNIPAGGAGTTSSTHFALGSQTVTAANIITAVNANSTTVTASSGGTGVVDLTAKAGGTTGNSYTLSENATSGVSVSGATFSGGTGTNTGTSFAVDGNTTDDATNLAAAITRNSSTAEVTATSSGTTVTVTAATPGSSGNGIALASGATGFSWSGSTLSGGADGATSGTNFAYWSGAAPVSTAQLASNLSTAIETNSSTDGVTSSYSSGNTFTVTATTAGAAGNSIALSASLTGFTWSGGTLTGGADGQASIVAFNNLYAGNNSATQTGTVESNSLTPPASGSITINGVALTSSLVSLAGQGGTFFGTVGTSGSITVTNGSNKLILTASPSSSGCSVSGSTTTATFVIATNPNNTTTDADNLAAAFAACDPGGAISGVTASASNPPAVSLKAVAYGTGSNSIALASTISGFSWEGATHLSGGADGSTSGTQFQYWSGSTDLSPIALATNIVSAITTNTTALGVSASNGGGTSATITLTANTAGSTGDNIQLAENYPTFTWSGTTLAGGGGDCPTGPSVIWAYNASTASPASPLLGSPVLSGDGTQVAFIESSSSGGAILHVLRPEASSGQQGNTTLNGAPVAPTTSTSDGPTFTSCLATANSCMFNLTVGSNTNSNSPPFYDYGSDTLWVGDDVGNLYEVTPVFNGSPAVVNSSPWSSSGRLVGNGKITGPVLDYGPLGNILVGDSGGALHSVSATGTTVTSVTNLGTIADSPIVDPSTNHVFVFSGGNGSAAQVTQYDTTTPLGNARPVSLGGSSSLTGSQLHDGIFDNNYYVNSASAGHLYVCGERSGTVAAPTLYDIGFSSTGVMNLTTSNSLNLTSNTTAGQCSPLTEIYNPNQGSGIDWLFVGVPASCAFGGSSTGCIMALQIGAGTTETFPTSATTAAENGGTSGIIVDNVSTQAGASSIYFTTLTAPGAGGCTPSEPSSDNTTCVVKRTQNGLQ